MTTILPITQSSTWLLTLLLTLTSHLHVALSNYEHTCSAGNQPHPLGVCGPALTRVIDTLCDALERRGFLARYMSKRDTRPHHIHEKMRGILLNKKQAFSFISKRSASGGIACECCYNQCHLYELAQYCHMPHHMYSKRHDILAHRRSLRDNYN